MYAPPAGVLRRTQSASDQRHDTMGKEKGARVLIIHGSSISMEILIEWVVWLSYFTRLGVRDFKVERI